MKHSKVVKDFMTSNKIDKLSDLNSESLMLTLMEDNASDKEEREIRNAEILADWLKSRQNSKPPISQYKIFLVSAVHFIAIIWILLSIAFGLYYGRNVFHGKRTNIIVSTFKVPLNAALGEDITLSINNEEIVDWLDSMKSVSFSVAIILTVLLYLVQKIEISQQISNRYLSNLLSVQVSVVLVACVGLSGM